MARWVWLLHSLAYSIEPEASIFQVRKGSRFSEVYMESVIDEMYLSPDSDPVVAFTVIPGFMIGKTTIQSRVYLSQWLLLYYGNSSILSFYEDHRHQLIIHGNGPLHQLKDQAVKQFIICLDWTKVMVDKLLHELWRSGKHPPLPWQAIKRVSPIF